MMEHGTSTRNEVEGSRVASPKGARSEAPRKAARSEAPRKAARSEAPPKGARSEAPPKDRQFKDRLFAELARPARALANPHRLELVDLLAQSERSVEDLATLTAMSVANASQHLQVLRSAGLVVRRREGAYVFYSLAGHEVVSAWQALRRVGEVRLAEVDRIVDEFLWDRALFTPMSAQELQALMRDDAVTVLDVRPESEFRAGHISGARSIPVAELSARLDEIPIDRPVVAYCRGPYCVFADDAVRLLTERGFAAHRLDEGLPEWRTAGLPVEVGSAIKEEEQS